MPMSRPTNTGGNRRGGRPAVPSRDEHGITWAGAPTRAPPGPPSPPARLGGAPWGPPRQSEHI